MKKILSCIIILFFITTLVLSVKANDSESKIVVNRNRINESTMMVGNLYSETADTYFNGYYDEATISSNNMLGLKPQTYHWVDVPSDNGAVKVVTWSTGTVNNWAGNANVNSNVITIAKDFEQNNPGWMVVAGANGDWFRINDTDEADNLMVQNGEVIRPETRGEDWRQVIGWKQNQELIIGRPTIDSHMTTHIYTDEETYSANYTNEIANFDLVGYNCEPSEKGVTLYTKDSLSEFDLTGYTVYIGSYDLCRYSYGNRKPFVKGEIVSIKTDLGVCKPIGGESSNNTTFEFYLATKEKINNLNIGNYVKCQFDLNGEWENVESACGTVNQILDDYNPMHYQQTDVYGYYDEKTACKPRLAFGVKEDGSYVAMAIEGRHEMSGSTGLSCCEAGELMRLAGCKTAFNLDGGGSTTLIVRNEYDDFDMVNAPSDGSIRSIGNAILFVVKDPGVSWDVAETNRFDATFNQTETKYLSEMQDVKMEINGVSKPFENGVVVLDNLEEDTAYVAKLTYKNKSFKDPNVLVDCSLYYNFHTKNFKMPSAGFKFKNINKNEVTLIRGNSDTSSWFENIQINFNDQVYNMGSDYEIKFDGLITDTEYIATISYEVVEPATGNRYYGSETKKVKTLAYQLPEIIKFEIYRQSKNRIIFSYEYTDEDNVVEYVNLLCNGVATPITQKIGTVTVSDLDFEKNEYTFKIQIAYDPGSAYLEQILSDEITVGTKVEEPIEVKHSITYVLDGGVLNDAPSEYVEGVGLEVLPTPTKEGYIFKGWYVGGEKVESINSEDNSDITLTAKWEEEVKEDPTPTPEPTPTPKPTETKKGCRKSASYIILLTTMLSCIGILLRKRK